MDEQRDRFLERLRSTFRIEAEEHLNAITAGVLELERSPSPEVGRRVVETVFRAAHSLKGAARAVDFAEVESLCQSLEDTLADWKAGRASPDRDAIDALHRTIDAISADIRGQAADASAPGAARRATPAGVAPTRNEPPATAAEHRPPAQETVRVAVAKLDARVLQAEEMLTAKLTVIRHADEVRGLISRFDHWRQAWSATEPHARALRQALERPAARPPDEALSRILQFLELNGDHMKSLEGRVVALAREAARDRHTIGKLVDDLREDARELLLLPFAVLAESFPKLVRDLCRAQDKEADLVVHGQDVEVDKRILEEMKAPLTHLLRNSVDHGIEAAEERSAAGKPVRASITLAASRLDGRQVQFVVSDDGRGLALDDVRAAAVSRGMISPEQAAALEAAQVARLAFEPEVTTRSSVTAVSGRGLGLAIVREHAERLGGMVTLESEPGRGTRFVITVPSILATFRGVLLAVAGQVYVAPTTHTERIVRVDAGDIVTIEGRDTISVGGRAVSLVDLGDVLESPPHSVHVGQAAERPAVVLIAGEQRVAVMVDAVLDEQEVLLKPFRKPLVRVRNLAGATVLGSGEVAPVLNVPDLLRSARKLTGLLRRGTAEAPAPGTETRSILVVEDSITSRMLIKGILESAGYRVTTSVDGVDAFTLLRTEHFDLVVSDVEMPRLDGFELTARIRADARLAHLPVVLVTALERREDRERGIDVGANAYIVKSRFDQSNLLEAVRRLA